MNLSKICVRRPVTTAMLLMIVVVVGFLSLIGIPMDLMPDMELPVALVMTQYPNASPEEVENLVTIPIENQLATVEDLDTLYSVTTSGMSIAMVQFAMGTDMNFASLDMREKIALVSSYLPDDATDPMVMKLDINATPIIYVYIAGDMSLSDLYNQVDGNIANAFERSSGVASISITGGVEEEIAVTFQQERLAGYGLTISTISQMLAAENLNMPSGSVDQGSKEMIVRTMGEFKSIDEIAQYPLTLPTREVIHLQDIASIEQRYKDQESISRIDGQAAIGISVTKQSVANTVDVSRAVQKTIANLEAQYPNLTFTIGYNSADFIQNSVNSVAQSAITGALLAIIVIFLFLRNVSSTLVIAISIPASFLATFALMNVMGMTLNMITLTALTLGVGMLVDNSVIVLENIYKINEDINNPEQAAIVGSQQILLSLTASTLTSIVVYLPIALSEGISAMLFRDFCFTIIFALLASLVVSVTVVPMLCSKMLKNNVSTNYMRIGRHRYRYRLIPYFSKMIESITDSYEKTIRVALKRRAFTVIACILIFVLSISLLGVVGMELLPATDEGSFSVSVDMPYGTSLADTNAVVTEIEDYLLTIPEMEHLAVSIGGSSMLGGSSNSLSATLTGREERTRSTAEVVKEVKEQFKDIVGADVTVEESSSVSTMMGGADISLTIKGEDLGVLESLTNELAARIEAVPGITDVTSSASEGNPEVQVRLNRTVASNYGVNAATLASQLRTALTGSTATKYKVAGQEIEVNLSLSDGYSYSVDSMKQILLSTTTGSTVPLGQIATFEFDNSPVSIVRQNQARSLTLSCYIDGRDLGSVSQDINKVMNSFPFPDGYYYDSGGQQEQMMEAFGTLALALLAAILLVYMLLAAQFESMVLPLVVMMAIPFAMSGAFIALFIVGMRLSMMAFIGLIMLVGIVVNNSILLIEFIHIYEETMERDEAIAMAGRSRLRPILMTTITTVVGMIPLSLGSGEGGEMLAPMGVSIMGGLIGSTLVTLILIPVIYAMNDNRRNKKAHRKEEKQRELEALELKWREEELNARI